MTLDEGVGDTVGAEARPATHSAAKIETHGIDVIPDAERYGKPSSLFWLWVAPNTNYLSFVIGGVLIYLGLELWQALLVVVVGTVFSAVPGIVAITGPVSGTPSQVVTRAMYGVRGNRVAIAVNGWFISVCYIAINWAAAGYIGFALVERTGVETEINNPTKVLVCLVLAAATLVISIYGQALINRLYGLLSTVLFVVFVLVSVYIFKAVDLGFRQPEPLHGVALWAALTGGVTLLASTPLSYTISSDFARYLPKETSSFAVAAWTALGSFVPGIVFLGVGVLGATAVDMTDPTTTLDAVVPGWLLTVFLISVIVATISNNALTTYSAGLALQAVGVSLQRAWAVTVGGGVALGMTLYALLVTDFLDSVSSVLSLLVVLVGPIMAVYMTDIYLRRNAYDGYALSEDGPTSAFWYDGGVNVAGAVACLGAAVAALLCASTPAFTGWIAQTMNGIDLSLPVGMIGASACYYLLTKRRYGLPVASSPASSGPAS